MDDKQKNGCLIGCLASAGCLTIGGLLGLLTLSACISSCSGKLGNMTADDDDGPQDAAPTFTEVWSLGNGSENDPKIVRMKLEGEIANTPRRHGILETSDPHSASAVLDRIHAADADEEVRGIWLEIDSPGGEVTMSDILFDALMRFRASDTNRFVLATIDDMAASGGYYVAAGANAIMAHPTSWTGSIGVIVPTYNASELASKIGIASVAVTSGANKNMLDPLQPTNAVHLAIIKSAVDEAYERFLSVVAEGRGMKVEDIRPYADGRILTAKQALDAKLIDLIGYEEDALDAICDLAGSDDVRVYRYDDDESLGGLFKNSLIFESLDGLADKLKARIDRAATPKAQYRFQ